MCLVHAFVHVQAAVTTWLRELDLVAPVFDELVEHIVAAFDSKALQKEVSVLNVFTL